MDENDLLAQVEFGSQVEVELIDQDGGRERLTVILVGEEAANLAEGLLGEQTPLARAIMGQPTGSRLPYQVGELAQVRILTVRRVAAPSATDAAKRRQAVLQKAIRDAERTNAEMFAASYSGKWGDYAATSDTAWEDKAPTSRAGAA